MTAQHLTREDVEILDDSLSGFRGDAKHIKVGDRFFVVSATVAPFSGPETLVFPADSDGEVTDWCEIAGGRGYMDHEIAIADLLDTLAGGESR